MTTVDTTVPSQAQPDRLADLVERVSDHLTATVAALRAAGRRA